jgi:hypothetical protein
MSRHHLDPAGAPPDDDILVWELDIPAEAEGAVIAVCDGYENKLQLRSRMDGKAGSFAAWVAPAYREEVQELLQYLSRRFGVRSTGPRPFDSSDLAAGMHITPRPGK